MARAQHIRDIGDDGNEAHVRAYLSVHDQAILQIKTHTREFQIYLTNEEATELAVTLTEAAAEASKPWMDRMAKRYGPKPPGS